MIIGRRDDAPTAATFVHQLNSAVDLIVQDLSTTETSHFYFRIPILLALKSMSAPKNQLRRGFASFLGIFGGRHIKDQNDDARNSVLG